MPCFHQEPKDCRAPYRLASEMPNNKSWPERFNPLQVVFPSFIPMLTCSPCSRICSSSGPVSHLISLLPKGLLPRKPIFRSRGASLMRREFQGTLHFFLLKQLPDGLCSTPVNVSFPSLTSRNMKNQGMAKRRPRERRRRKTQRKT